MTVNGQSIQIAMTVKLETSSELLLVLTHKDTKPNYYNYSEICHNYLLI